MFKPLVIAFLSTCFATMVIVATRHLHAHVSADGTSGPQKIHKGAVPRVGGLAIVIGSLAGGLALAAPHGVWFITALCATPAFVAGLLEDITKRVTVRTRLFATLFAGALFSWSAGYSLHHLGMPGVDVVLAFPIIAMAFTAFAIAGVANAINIIDGCNGLASGTSILIAVGFGAIAWSTGDSELAAICFLVAAAIGGFWVWNFPFGKIFLGDAGAYTVGFVLAAVAVALPARNPLISPEIGLLMLIYPVSETIYSMIRRAQRGRGKVGQPDSLHLHSLVFQSLRGVVKSDTLRNSAAGGLLWLLPLTSAGSAYLLRGNSITAVLFACVIFFVFYCMIYATMSRVAVKTMAKADATSRMSRNDLTSVVRMRSEAMDQRTEVTVD